MKKKTILTIYYMLTICVASSQENVQKSIDDFQKTTKAAISLNKSLNIPDFIKFPINKPYNLKGNSLKQKVNSFFNEYKAIYAIKDVKETLKDDAIKEDMYGLKHYTLKQYYKGVPVFDAELRFHFGKNEGLKSISGKIIPNINISSTPKISKRQAGDIALKLVKNQNLNKSGKTLKIEKNRLYVFARGLVQGYVTSKHLVYRIEVRNNQDVREFLFIEAHTGKLIEQFTGIAHALNRTIYDKNLDNIIYTEGGNTFSLKEGQKRMVEASGHTYYFFKHTFGFDSYDNNGAEMKAIYDYDGFQNCNTSPNAFWNGSFTAFCDYFTNDDTIAHEWGHAYIEYTADFIYSYESGALHEAFADIWGETIDLLNNYKDEGEDHGVRSDGSITDRWNLGEQTLLGEIRDMWDPTRFGDPGKVTDTEYWCASSDNGGVHINSGIPNHAYALIVDGGSYNGQTINGLGFIKAAHIFWRAQSEYLTQTSGFANFADAIEASCADLIGINLEGISVREAAAGLSGEIITAADYTAVTNALLAVELRSANECVYETVLGPSTALCEAASSNPIFFEDWESGLGAWTVSQLPENPSTWESRDWTIEASLPNDRAGKAIYATDELVGDNCDGADFENGILRLESPIITIPSYANGTFSLAFNHSHSSEADYDGGNIKYSLDGGEWTILPALAFTENPYNSTLDNSSSNTNPMKGEEAFSGIDLGPGVIASAWGQSTIDLSAIGVIANSSLKLRWEFGTDDCNGKIGWFIDEIVIFNCDEALSTNNFDFLDTNVRISPNPSAGVFNVEMQNISDFQYEIYDITGKSIVNSTDITKNSFSIDLSIYSKGLYFIKLYSKIGTITKKLVRK